MLCEHSHNKEFGLTSACCQFLYEFHENELIDVDDKKLCPCHAPLEDENVILPRRKVGQMMKERIFTQSSTTFVKMLQKNKNTWI